MNYDVAVAGGGIVGLTFVRLLADALSSAGIELRIAVIEPRPPAATENAVDQLRVSAVAPVAQQILHSAGVWQSVAAADDSASCAYTDMYVWYAENESAGPQSLTFSASELGAPALGYIVRNKALRDSAWAGLAALAQVDLLSEVAPVALDPVSDGWRIQMSDDSVCDTALLIAADGARSAVRELLGLRTERHDYAQQAIVAEIATERPHQRTARQRFLPGGPVAMLPLANGNCSLVWSCPEAEAADLLALGNEEFAERLTNASDNVLGRLECVSERLSFPLASNRALRYIDRRCALLGDAAHQVHPLAGQGLNLGLLDAASLAAELTAHMQLRGADPGDRRVLRRFERARKGDNVLTQRVLSGLNDVFRSDLAPAAARGMSLLDSAGSLKRLLAGYAMGDLRAASAASRISH